MQWPNSIPSNSLFDIHAYYQYELMSNWSKQWNLSLSINVSMENIQSVCLVRFLLYFLISVCSPVGITYDLVKLLDHQLRKRRTASTEKKYAKLMTDHPSRQTKIDRALVISLKSYETHPMGFSSQSWHFFASHMHAEIARGVNFTVYIDAAIFLFKLITLNPS